MRSHLIFLNASFLLLLILMAGCQKDSPSPEETAKKLFEDIQGKWEFDAPAFRLEGARKASTIGTSFPEMTSLGKRVELYSTAPSKGFIEFLNDSTFIVVDADANTIVGRFAVKTSITVSLEGLGEIADIKIDQDRMNFKLLYFKNTLSFTSNKVAEIASDNRTNLITRRWRLDIDRFILDNDRNDILATEEKEYVNRVRLELIMSKHGTQAFLFYLDDKLDAAESTNWKWHDTKENVIVFWRWREEVVEYAWYGVITELTDKAFEFYEEWENSAREKQVFKWVAVE